MKIVILLKFQRFEFYDSNFLCCWMVTRNFQGLSHSVNTKSKSERVKAWSRKTLHRTSRTVCKKKNAEIEELRCISWFVYCFPTLLSLKLPKLSVSCPLSVPVKMWGNSLCRWIHVWMIMLYGNTWHSVNVLSFKLILDVFISWNLFFRFLQYRDW